MQKEDHVKTPKGDDRLQAKERGLRINLTCNFQNCEELILLFKPPRLEALCYSSPTNTPPSRAS